MIITGNSHCSLPCFTVRCRAGHCSATPCAVEPRQLRDWLNRTAPAIVRLLFALLGIASPDLDPLGQSSPHNRSTKTPGSARKPHRQLSVPFAVLGHSLPCPSSRHIVAGTRRLPDWPEDLTGNFRCSLQLLCTAARGHASPDTAKR